MKKKTPFLDYYKVSVITGYIPNSGLCNSLLDKKLLRQFRPTERDARELLVLGLPRSFWGSGEPLATVVPDDLRFRLTPIRANVLLFCAVINKEL